MSSVMITRVRELICDLQFANATALAALLHRSNPSDETIELLGTALIHQFDHINAYDVLRESNAERNRYLRAVCCLHLDKLKEAETALLPNFPKDDVVMGGASGLYLLGKVCLESGRREKAKKYLTECVRLDPLMIVALEQLAKLDCDVISLTAYPAAAPILSGVQHSHLDHAMSQYNGTGGMDSSAAVMNESSFSLHGRNLDLSLEQTPSSHNFQQPSSRAHTNDSVMSAFAAGTNFATPHSISTPNQPESSKYAPPKALKFDTPSSMVQPGTSASRVRFDSASMRRTDQTPEMSFHLNQREGETPGSLPPQPSRSEGLDAPQRPPQPMTGDKSASDDVMHCIGIYAAVAQNMAKNYSRDALQLLRQLPAKHWESGRAQRLVGVCCFDMGEYASCIDAFKKMLEVEPHSVSGLEYMSTALWQLNKRVELSYLSQQVLSVDRSRPEVWCVLGNCLSLEKEHEQAIKVFKRAIQIDSSFTYAYTLCGLEYIASEDFEKAMEMFRGAIQRDERHYKAWYGLGSIYLSQEKFGLAEYHYRKALSLNPESSVLYCHLAGVLHKNKKLDEALQMLDIASIKAPNNPQVNFTRSQVLESKAIREPSRRTELLEQAVEELQTVRARVPKEAQVYLRLGNLCKKLDRKAEALKFFTFAYDLDPRDTNQVKAALERIEQPDLEEDST